MWPSSWTDRLNRDRTPSIPGHELAGVVTALGYGSAPGALPTGRRHSTSGRRSSSTSRTTPWRTSGEPTWCSTLEFRCPPGGGTARVVVRPGPLCCSGP
nr:hypothetical protein [Streptomyces yatensis]